MSNKVEKSSFARGSLELVVASANSLVLAIASFITAISAFFWGPLSTGVFVFFGILQVLIVAYNTYRLAKNFDFEFNPVSGEIKIEEKQ